MDGSTQCTAADSLRGRVAVAIPLTRGTLGAPLRRPECPDCVGGPEPSTPQLLSTEERG